MQNAITYAGRVTIKVKNKPPVRKLNAGTPVLFSFLCNLIAGVSLKDLDTQLPVKIALIHSQNKTITDETLNTQLEFDSYSDVSLLTSELHITDRKVNSSTSSVYFSSLLLHSQLKTYMKSVANTSKTCYALLLNNNNDILAHAPFEYTDIVAIWEDVNGQGAIEWEMFFANKEVSI
jgi:hypothetical protein